MKAVLQRVQEADVRVGSETVGKIGRGVLILICIEKGDTEELADKLALKIVRLRFFQDENGKMNRSLLEIQGELLVVSQFTLAADLKRGNRPSFDSAERPDRARELTDYFIHALKKNELKVETGRFAAMMKVSLINDGPVTFLLSESNN